MTEIASLWRGLFASHLHDDPRLAVADNFFVIFFVWPANAWAVASTRNPRTKRFVGDRPGGAMVLTALSMRIHRTDPHRPEFSPRSRQPLERRNRRA